MKHSMPKVSFAKYVNGSPSFAILFVFLDVFGLNDED